MAWDWNKSGRVDSFEFEKISCKDLNVSLGSLECSVVKGTLHYSYYSQLKVSGELEVVNAPSSMSEQEYLIRIWYCPKLDGQERKIELGTFYFTAELHYENGMYKGKISLKSTIARHIDDTTIKKWTLHKNKTVSSCFKNVFKSLGGWPKIDGIRDRKIDKTFIFDVGVAPITILEYLADYCGGEINVDTHGRTVLQNYVSPSNKKNNISHYVVADTTSVIQAGLDISNSIKDIPNRVVCAYEETRGKKKVIHIGKAALAPNEARSHKNTGRWITAYYSISNCKKPYQKNLQAQAKKYLKSLNNKKVYYEFDTYYQPIEIGEVIQLKYDNIVVNGLVSDIDLSLSVGANMRVKIRKV